MKYGGCFLWEYVNALIFRRIDFMVKNFSSLLHGIYVQTRIFFQFLKFVASILPIFAICVVCLSIMTSRRKASKGFYYIRNSHSRTVSFLKYYHKIWSLTNDLCNFQFFIPNSIDISAKNSASLVEMYQIII